MVRSWRFPSATSLLALLLAASGPPIASAPINTGDSIEWLCECMPHIGILEVELRADVPNPAAVRALRLTVGRTTRVMKGRPPNEAAIECFDGVRLKPGGRASLLTFFDEALQAKYAIALDDSESCGAWPAITADFRVLRGRNDILAAAEERLKRLSRERAGETRGDRRRYLTVPVPGWTRAGEVLFEGSATLLNVPADSEYRQVLLRNLRSKHASVRASTALHLGEYPGEETVAALKELLADPATDSRGRTSRIYYPARRAAYLALRKLGIDVPRPEGFVEDPMIEWMIRANPADDQPTLFR